MKKVLVIMDDLYDQYKYQTNIFKNCDLYPALNYRKNGLLIRTIRKVHLSAGFIPFKKIWFDSWVRRIKIYDTVVLGDSGNTANIVKYINQKFPRKRVIVWYRNSASSTISPDKFQGMRCELWSFDKKDCEKYKMGFNSQFYIPDNEYKEHEIKYDVVFVGKDKGRLAELLKIEKKLNLLGLTTQFCIVGYNSEKIVYRDIVKMISAARCIMDFQCEWQDGITLRPLEAIFYRKKLITNCTSIKDMEFYRPNNIFILNQNNHNDIVQFMDAKYEEIPEQIVKYYSMDSWITRFGCKEIDK